MTLPRKQETAIWTKQQTRRPCDLAAAILPVLRWSDVFLCVSLLLRLPFPISMNTHIWLFYKWLGHYPLRWQKQEQKSVKTPAVNVLNSKCVSDWSYPWLFSYYSFFFFVFLFFNFAMFYSFEMKMGKENQQLATFMKWCTDLIAGRISCFRLAPMKDLLLHPVALMLWLALKNTSYSVSSINHCALERTDIFWIQYHFFVFCFFSLLFSLFPLQ